MLTAGTYLAPIELARNQSFQLLGFNLRRSLGGTSSLEKMAPNHRPGRQIQFFVSQHQVDAREDRFVEFGHAVGGQEHDALAVFEFAKEDRDERVADEVVRGTALEEDVGFVEQEDGVPVPGDLENLRELRFHF